MHKLSCKVFRENIRLREQKFMKNSGMKISLLIKRQFLCLSILQTPILRARQRTGSREEKRLYTLKYYFLIDGEKIQVCRTYFLNTLDISQTFVRFSLQKRQSSGMFECDKRGKQPSVNKIKDEDKNAIRQHIMSFPCEEAHRKKVFGQSFEHFHHV